MEDRFKFRFWHKPTKRMLKGYGYNGDFVFADTLTGIGTEYNPAKQEDCVLMQCTALKDMNGKLIYEGDIVLWKSIRYKVVWNGYKYILEEIGSQLTDVISDYTAQFYKVTGNIYENPELLEVENE